MMPAGYSRLIPHQRKGCYGPVCLDGITIAPAGRTSHRHGVRRLAIAFGAAELDTFRHGAFLSHTSHGGDRRSAEFQGTDRYLEKPIRARRPVPGDQRSEQLVGL